MAWGFPDELCSGRGRGRDRSFPSHIPGALAFSPLSPWVLLQHRRRNGRQEASGRCMLCHCLPFPFSAPPTSLDSRLHRTGDSQTRIPGASRGSQKHTDAIFPGWALRAPQRAHASPCLSFQDFRPTLLLVRWVSSFTEQGLWRRGSPQLLCSFSLHNLIYFWNEGHLFLQQRIRQHQPPRGPTRDSEPSGGGSQMPQDLTALPSGVTASFPGCLLFMSEESLAQGA